MQRIAEVSRLRGELPNRVAVRNADKVRLEAALLGLAPSTVVPDADGGVALYFKAGHRKASVVCDNSGVLVVVFDDAGTLSADEFEEDELGKALLRVRDFVQSLRDGERL